MEKERILKQMFHLSRPVSREIIQELLKRPCNVEQLRSALRKASRSPLLRILDELESDGIVEVTEIETKRPGRRKKKYTIRFLYVPAMSNEEIKMLLSSDQEFLEVQNMDSISFKLKNMENIIVKTENGYRYKLPLTRLVNLLVDSGLTFNESFHLLFFDISENLYYDVTEDEINDMILYNLKMKYPHALEEYLKFSGNIRVKMETNRELKEKKMGDFEMLGHLELGVKGHDSFFLANETYRLLQSARIREIDYISLIFLMHAIARNRGIQCQKPQLFEIRIPTKCKLILIPRHDKIQKRIIDLLAEVLDSKTKEEGSLILKIIGESRDLLGDMIKEFYPILIDELERLGKSYFPSAPLEKVYPEKKIEVTIEDESKEMNTFDIAEYLIRFFCLDEENAEFIAREILERIQRLSLQKYPLSLLMEISKSLLEEYKILYRRPI